MSENPIADSERIEAMHARDEYVPDPGDTPTRAEAEADRIEELRAESRAAAAYRRARRESSGLQPCVNCGALSPRRWCSASCMAAEDGAPYDVVEEEVEENEC